MSTPKPASRRAAAPAPADAPPAAAPPLAQMRALYENWAAPVAEIARCAGIAERTLYRHVRKGGWRRRHPYRYRGRAAGDPETRPELAAALMRLAEDAQAHAARAEMAGATERSLRTIEMLSEALVEIERQRSERPDSFSRAAERFAVRLQDAIVTAMGREFAGGA
jgi:hypothetical protein